MDGLALSAASAAVLADVNRTTQFANDFLNDVASAQDELEPVLLELFELDGLVRHIRNGGDDLIPQELRSSLTQTLQSCAKVCKSIDAVLVGCGEGSVRAGHWAMADAPLEVQQWKVKLEFGRRTVKVAVGALETGDHEALLEDLEHLRQELAPEVSQMESRLSDCLDAVESFLTAKEGSASGSGSCHSNRASLDISPPATPSIPEIISSFRKSSLEITELEDLGPYPMARKLEPGPLLEPVPPHSPLETILDEDLLEIDVSPRPGRRSMSPPPPPLGQRRLLSGSGFSPIYPGFPPSPTSPLQVNGLPPPAQALSPPTSPPPDKALPPIPVPVPPPRSPRRPSSGGPSSPRAPIVPTKSRARAVSDITHDSSKLSPNLYRWSGSSHSTTTTLPVRSSSCSNSNRNQSQPHNRPSDILPSPIPDTISESNEPCFELIPLRRLEHEDKDTASYGGVYAIDTSSSSNIIASRHGKFHVKIRDLSSPSPTPNGSATPTHTATIKVPFYVQAQPRSREFFVRCQAILSETRNLVAIATGFGQNVEIWNWAKRKKLQTLHETHRWASLRADIASQPQHQRGFFPLATYREDENIIKLYPVSPSTSSKPLGKPRIIDLRKANLPHVPKLPELAYSPTAPLLLAAAGPRPPRPNAPPPAHAALLMAWQLDGDARIHSPYKYLQTNVAEQPELANALPLWLATYGSVAVSIWAPSKFRTIGGPVIWQVEPVVVTEKVVLVWDFGGGSGERDTVTTYRIPDVLACVSPDCRFVAYCDPGSREGGPGALVVLDAMKGGKELWRLNGSVKEEAAEHSSGRNSFRRSGMSSDTWRSVAARSIASSPTTSSKSEGSLGVFGSGGLDSLAASLDKVTELAFSGDGTQLFVGDVDGGIGVYEVREGIGMTT